MKGSDLRSALRLGEILMSEGKMAEWQLSEALERRRSLAREEGQPPHLGDVLVSLSFVSREDPTRAYARLMGLPYADLREERVDPGTVLPRLVVYFEEGEVLKTV